MTVYVGTYGAGIWIFERDGARLSFLDRVDAPDPSFLVADPDPPVLYAVDELTDPSVDAFAIDEDGGLRELNRQPTGGAAPCHLLRHPAGYLLAANYDGGSVSVHPIRPDGSLGARTDLVRHTGSGPDPERQAGPHAHEVKLAGDLVVVVDLGLDRLIGYHLDPTAGGSTSPTGVRTPSPPSRSTRPATSPRSTRCRAAAHGPGISRSTRGSCSWRTSGPAPWSRSRSTRPACPAPPATRSRCPARPACCRCDLRRRARDAGAARRRVHAERQPPPRTGPTTPATPPPRSVLRYPT